MYESRPDIIIFPDQPNDLIALLNAQASDGFDLVAQGQALRVQNKTDVIVHVHKTDKEITSFVGGKSLPNHWQEEVEQGALGCIVTCTGKAGRIYVEVAK